jgi:hypothetical protein
MLFTVGGPLAAFFSGALPVDFFSGFLLMTISPLEILVIHGELLEKTTHVQFGALKWNRPLIRRWMCQTKNRLIKGTKKKKRKSRLALREVSH